jgi:curved DNA-binding protein CbpA
MAGTFNETFYEALQTNRRAVDADPTIVETNYRRLVTFCHPDRLVNASDQVKREGIKRFRFFTEARDVS